MYLCLTMGVHRVCAIQLLLTVYFFLFPGVVKSQVCPRAAGGTLPAVVDRGWEPRIPDRNQAIVTSYEFQCCGSIAEWGADVYSNCVGECDDSSDSDDGGMVIQRFNIQFQVWRPSPTVAGDGCYSLVGENRVTSVTLQAGVIRETPLLSQRIAVQPGDVVGFRLVGQYHSAAPGVVLDDSYSRETVWYANTAAGPSNCPYPVGNGRALSRSTNHGPVITASLATTECPLPIIVPTTTSRPSPLVTPTPTTDPPTTDPPATTDQGITDTTTTGLENSVPTTTDSVPSTELDQGSNEFAVGGAGERSVTVSVPTASPSPSAAISTDEAIIIIASGGVVVVFLVIASIIVGILLCRKIGEISKEDIYDAGDPRFSQSSLNYNSAYPGAGTWNAERAVSNSVYQHGMDEPIYEDI